MENDYDLMKCNKCNYYWFRGLLWYGGKVGQVCSKCNGENIQLVLTIRNNGKDLNIINKKFKQNYNSVPFTI